MGDKVGSVPLWQEIAAKLRGEIRSGQYEDGDTFLTGAEIAEKYGVSATTTVRRAVEVLEREGLLTSGQGRLGRQVRLRKPLTFHATQSESSARADERKLTGVDAWVADARDQERIPGQEISVAIEEPGPEVASRLNIPPGEAAVVRRRVRTLDGDAHNLNDTWYPLSIAEGTPIMHPADVKQGVIALMREMGYVQVRYTDEVTARPPTDEEQRRLQIPDGVPVLVQFRTGFTETEPVKLTITVWPADRANLIYELPA